MSKAVWYLSYVGEDPEPGFRGAVIIEADSAIEAARLANERGLSPGGQVMALEVPSTVRVEERWLNRLLNRAEIEEATGGSTKTVRDLEQECEAENGGATS